ncbi:MAG: hypothetical protein ACR2JM_02440 [Mycobacterium sp.]
MQSTRLQQRWAGACILALLLANWVGGFSVVVTAVFVVIYLTGMMLIGQDTAEVAVADPGTETELDTEPESQADPVLPVPDTD